MNFHLVVLVAVAFGHVVVADNVASFRMREEKPFSNAVPLKNFVPAPSLGKKMIADIIDKVARGFKPSFHIAGGVEVVPHSYPHQVHLFITKSNETETVAFLCGGSLLTSQWVLSAAHCIRDVDTITASLGRHDVTELEADTQVIQVSDIYTQPYDPLTKANDIALLKLAKPAKLNNWVQTIRLPPLSWRAKSLWNVQVVLTGWGDYSDDIEESSPVLRAAKSRVIPNMYCRLFGPIIRSSMLCVDGSDSKGACQGDSGGPLTVTEADGQRTLIGVTSFGFSEGCEKGYPTVFTRVDAYLGWIYRHTGLDVWR